MKKILVVGIIVLFIGVSFTSCVGVNVEQTNLHLNLWNGAWWEFNEGSGNTAYDSTGHGHDGTVYGATWTAEGLSFDGIDDYVDFDAHATALGINKTDDYVIQVIFRSTGSGMLYSMSHTNPERAYFDLMLDEEGKVGVIIGDITCVFELFTSGSYNDGDWHVIESEFWGDTVNPTLDLYVDGELEATKTEWLSPMLDEDFLTAKVGRDSNAESDYFIGEIDDIKIYMPPDYPKPPEAPTIDGPSDGPPGELLTFIFNAEDPDSDFVRFHIDWGDGEEWTSYVPQGTDKEVTHMWSTRGAFVIEVYAVDQDGNIGPTSTMSIPILRNKILNFNCLKWRLNQILQVLQRFSISTDEVKHETTVRIHRSNGITPFTLKLTEKESNEIDNIFDNLKVRLDSAETDEEIDAIYDEAVESLFELGMFPKMTIKEAKQLVNCDSKKTHSGNIGTRESNSDCSIAGQTTYTYMFDLGNKFWNGFLRFLRWLPFGCDFNFLYYNGLIGNISFGECTKGYPDWNPSIGWVHTNGTNGVVKWEGEFYGARGERQFYGVIYEYLTWVFDGVENFEGLWIDRWNQQPPCYLGNADHVNLRYDRPPSP